MGARRPKAAKTEAEPLVTPAALPSTAGDGPPRRFYASLRVKESPGKLRFSSGPKLVEASNEQTIELRKEPYTHFLVMPGGTEIPVENVSGAIAIGSEIAQRMSRSERLEKRKAALQEKMGQTTRATRSTPVRAPKDAPPRKREGVQEVPEEEDDIDDSLDEDEFEGEPVTEGEDEPTESEGDDGED